MEAAKTCVQLNRLGRGFTATIMSWIGATIYSYGLVWDLMTWHLYIFNK